MIKHIRWNCFRGPNYCACHTHLFESLLTLGLLPRSSCRTVVLLGSLPRLCPLPFLLFLLLSLPSWYTGKLGGLAYTFTNPSSKLSRQFKYLMPLSSDASPCLRFCRFVIQRCFAASLLLAAALRALVFTSCGVFVFARWGGWFSSDLLYPDPGSG